MGAAGGARGGDPDAHALALAIEAAAILRDLSGVGLAPAEGCRATAATGVRFEFRGADAGQMTLVFDDRLLRRLVIALCARLGAPFEPGDFHDAVAELGNLVASGIANRLDAEGAGIEISTPGVAVSSSPACAPPGASRVRLVSPEGEMELEWRPMELAGERA
jgi:hypothetical protein